MIDFSDAKYLKLRPVNADKFLNAVQPMFVPGEECLGCFQSIRDYVLFTTKRIITVNVQGLTGKKQDYTSLPYSKIQAFSIETAGVLDLDSELELWFSGLGKVHLEFSRGTNIAHICKMISVQVL